MVIYGLFMTIMFTCVRFSALEFHSTNERFPLVVHSTGQIQWFYPTILKTSCLLDVTYFPWDVQVCK